MDPNNHQRSALASHAGAARFAYNTMLTYVRHALETRSYERRVLGEVTTQVPWNAYALRKAWNNEVKNWAAPWWRENSKEAYASGIAALASALANFSSSKKGTRRGRRVGFPRHKKRHARRSFTVTTGSFGAADARHVRLPVIGTVRVKEQTTGLVAALDDGHARALSVTVSETAGRWFVSFQVAQENEPMPVTKPAAVAGVDLGINALATVVTIDQETGEESVEVVANPKALSRYERRMRHQAKVASRRQRGSRRHAQAQRRLARTHYKVANIRRDAAHKLTTRLASTYGTVVVEDLGVAGMVKNHHLAKSVSDASFGELRRQLTYKTTWHRGTLVVADRFYPSSKTCSGCGWRKPSLPLSERRFICEQCGLVCDRDVNAARNLARLGLATPLPDTAARGNSPTGPVAVSGTETQNARGEESAGPVLRLVKLSSVKREAGTGAVFQDGAGKTSTATRQLVAA